MRVSSASQDIRYLSVIYALLSLNLSAICKLQFPDPDSKNLITKDSLRSKLNFSPQAPVIFITAKNIIGIFLVLKSHRELLILFTYGITLLKDV